MLSTVAARDQQAMRLDSSSPLPGRGTPAWLGLHTPDLAASAAFYAALFEWRFETTEIAGTPCATISQWGRPFALAVQFPVAARWVPDFATEALDADAETVRKLGGRVVSGPYELPGIGSLVEATDPGGAPFGLLHHDPAPPALPALPGYPIWHELDSAEAEASLAFYSGLFGYRHKAAKAPTGADYTILELEQGPVAGVLALEDSWPETIPPRWLTFFVAESVATSLARVEELGGKAGLGPLDSPNGEMAIARDPDGAAFCLIAPTSRPGSTP
jgi:uncharacterized protein